MTLWMVMPWGRTYVNGIEYPVRHSHSTASAYLDCQHWRERAREGEQDGCVWIRHDFYLVKALVVVDELEEHFVVPRSHW